VCGMLEVKRDAAADLAMCEAATPGPWGVDDGDCDAMGIFAPDNDPICYVSENPGCGIGLRGRSIDEANARLIAESRTALPHWIKRAQEAEKRISAACDKLNSLITLISMAGGAGESVDIWGLSSELCAIASELESE
jgi:hypothetical protein